MENEEKFTGLQMFLAGELQKIGEAVGLKGKFYVDFGTQQIMEVLQDDRKDVLLRAAYDLLKKCDNSHYVLNALETTVHYDDTECDGNCLMEDIAIELGLFPTAPPAQCSRLG